MPAKLEKKKEAPTTLEIYNKSLADPARMEPSVTYALRKVTQTAEAIYLGKDPSDDRRKLVDVIAFDMAKEAVAIAGPGATDLEILLACRIVATERLVISHERGYYRDGSYMPETIKFMDRRIDAMNRRLQQGAVALAKVRRLRTAPGPTVNMAAVLVTGGSALPTGMGSPVLESSPKG